jgi:predicted AAA+ superfamily ATPase
MFNRWLKLNNKKSLILLGPRRVGKSTLLKMLFPSYQYVTLDDLDELEYSKKDPKEFINKLGNHFIIDEAQRNTIITLPLKKLIDEKKIHFILTGSVGLNLKDSVGDTLAGRVDIKYLPPCCFGEHLGDKINSILHPMNIKDIKEASRKIEDYIQYGGFPELLLPENENIRDDLLKNYKNTYFTRDLAALTNIENVEGLKAIFQALMKGIGSRYEYSSLQKESGLTYITTKKYLNTLLSSGLAFKLYGYHLGTAKRYISAAKTYFIDNGIINAMTDECSKGQLVENMIVSEIEKRRQINEIQCDELFYYESAGGREIDVIVEEKKQITAIEIKASATITGRDLRNIRELDLKTKKPIRKWIIYLGNEMYHEDEILILPYCHFFRRSWE